MAKKKTLVPTAGAPLGTFIYFLLKPDGTVLASFGAGTTTLDNPARLSRTGPPSARRRRLAGGEALLVLKR